MFENPTQNTLISMNILGWLLGLIGLSLLVASFLFVVSHKGGLGKKAFGTLIGVKGMCIKVSRVRECVVGMDSHGDPCCSKEPEGNSEHQAVS